MDGKKPKRRYYLKGIPVYASKVNRGGTVVSCWLSPEAASRLAEGLLAAVNRSEGKDDLAEAMNIAYVRGGYKGALKSRLEYYKNRRQAGSHVNFWDEALTYAQLGQKELTLDTLEKAYAEREDLTDLAVDPNWDLLRTDPRFQELVRRIGLPMKLG